MVSVLVSKVAKVVRGPAGLEAGFVTKLFIIQLKLKVQKNVKLKR